MTTRRNFLLGAGLLLTAKDLFSQTGSAEEARRRAAAQEAVRKLTNGAPVRPGRVKLDLPPLIDNGNTVPLSVKVDSPMTRADHVRSIHVIAQKNPQPYVVSAFLGPRAGRAGVSTRARIADTQTVLALAQMSDGSWWSDTMDVVVTLSACLEDGSNLI
jgi:sulfur-oxidizing protein SoxY